jgi:glycine/D-amino acid oxidase-like deaminating enzyme
MNPAEKPVAARPVTASAAVIGGGIVGLACALELQRRGFATRLFDPAMLPRAASWGNAGHIATEQVEPLASRQAIASLPRRLFSRGGAAAFPARDIGSWLPFGWRLLRASSPPRFAQGCRALHSLLSTSLDRWRHLASSIRREELIADDGHYVVWETPQAARTGIARWSCTDIGTARLRELARDELAQIGTLMSRIPAGGLRFTGTGRVRDPGALLAALELAFVAAGGELRREPVRGLEFARAGASLRLHSGESSHPDLVLVAAGVGSAALLGGLGYRVPIIAERGYHIECAGDAWPDMPPVVFEERSMIVSRFHSGLRAAGFVEFSRESSPPDARKWQRLRAHVAQLGLPFRGEPREWLGARPTLPDYLPAIGRSARAPNLLYAFGHQHLGLTLAAITAELIGTLAKGDETAIDLRPFALERFQ